MVTQTMIERFRLDRGRTGRITLQGRIERLEMIVQILFLIIVIQFILRKVRS